MASVTTTDVFTSIAALQASAISTAGTLAYVIASGKAVQWVYLTTAVGAPSNGWYKVVAR